MRIIERNDKMITINKNIQGEMICMLMEEMVPENSLFRKIDKYIDFTFIYDEVKDLYCEDNGRPSLDPVVLFKLVFIQALDGLKSMRKTCDKIKVDAEYRWFLNIPFGQDTPHFSTFSKNYERRFKDNDIFERIFIHIVNQAIQYKLVEGETLFTDSTHKKANANKNKFVESIESNIKTRRKWLENEINEERRKNGKKEFIYKDGMEDRKIKQSTTDKESGYYHRDNKEKGFMYLDHRTVDGKANIIVDCHITKGNVHDSKPYIDRIEHIKKVYHFDIKKVALDSGYESLDIKKYLIDNNIFGVIGYRRYGNKETRKYKNEFYYDNELDIYVKKETGEVLKYTGLIDRNGYKKYSDLNKEHSILRHIKEEINETFKNNRLSEEGTELYKLRKEKVERSFADSKQNHGYRYAVYRGLKKNQDYTWLICAAQNMKNISLKVDRHGLSSLLLKHITRNYSKLVKTVNIFFQISKLKPLV